MKARIRRISSSVDTALSPTSSSDACIHVSDLNSSTEISHGYNNPSSKSLDICVSESRIERMRKLLSSPLLKRRNASQHSALCASHQKQLPPSSSSSSSPSSSPALASNASMKTFGVSLESLSHHQHPHHQQQHHHQCPEYNVRDPEQIIVPHQKAAHILGQVCPGCLTSAPSNSSSNGSINDTSSGHFSSHCNQLEDLNSSLSSIVASPSSGNSSSSTTSSASSTGAPNIPCLIPYIVTRLCNYIENSGGMLQEGLFRISGNAKLVEKLKQSFDQFGDAPLETDGDLAAASALLKQFLRELPQPLIPNGPQFLDVIRSLKNDHETCVLSLKALISQLPDENYYTLRYLIRFLYKIAQKNEENRMTSSNLGIIFAPNIFRVCVDTYQGLKDQSSANEVVNLLITDFTEIFNETIETVGQSVDRVDSFGDMPFESNKAQCFCPYVEMNKQDCHSNCENLVVTIESSGIAQQQPATLNDNVQEIMDGNDRNMILKLDRKRKTYQTKNHRTIDEFSNEDRCQSFDDEQNSEHSRVRPQRCNSEEMFTKTDSSKISAKMDDSYGKNLHSHEIIITNSSDSVSTDDNTTTATSTGPTVCSVIIGVEQIDICNQSGDMTDISEDNFGQNLPKYSKLLTCDMSDVKGPRSSSGGSDCTDNLNIPNSLSFASDEDDDSLMKSIASECSDNDSTGSNSARESICSDNEQALKDCKDKLEIEMKNDNSIKNEQTFNSHLLESKPWSKNNDWLETEPTPISKHHLFSEDSADYIASTGETNEEIPKEALTSDSAFQYLSSNRAISPNETNFGPSPSSHRENNNNLDVKQKSADESEFIKIPKSRNRRLQSIRRKLKQFEIDFEQENGFKPTLENKMASSFARPLMLELSTIVTETNDPKGMEHFKKDLDFDLNKTNVEEDNVEDESSHNYVWKYKQNNSHVFTTEDIFNTIFGSRKEKNLMQISEMINEIQRILQEKRIIAQRPESLDLMTSEQIFDEKLALQKVLLRFEALNGRPNSKAERDIVRPVYDRYRMVKRYAIRFNQKQNPKVENAELQPIIENVQMNFISPTHQQMSTDVTKDSKQSLDKVFKEPAVSLENIPEDTATSSNIGQKSCDIMNSKAKNYHVMSHCELLSNLQEYRQQKRNLRAVLRTFENDFYKKTGRRVEKEDRSNMSSVYTCYKNTKAKIRLIEALVAKIANE